jgi:L-rhamnose mutarotase
MPTFAQAIDLVDDPERIAEYRRLHARIWPEVAAGLRSLGLSNMRIWISGRRLFMTYDAPDGFDPTRDYQGYASNPRVQEWDALMRTFQRQVPGARPGEWWSAMDLVFDLDQQP